MGITEAVFSSSGDRIRAIQAKAAVAGASIAFAVSRSWFDQAWRGRVSVPVAEGLFSDLFPSDCRISGEPPVHISRLPVCQGCLDALHRAVAGVGFVCGERLGSSYVLSVSDGEPRCGLCRLIARVLARAVAFGSELAFSRWRFGCPVDASEASSGVQETRVARAVGI
ncbi:MAG: hypothetical protein WB762_15400 [Candidatus Sulfotelmatobacter sp.]